MCKNIENIYISWGPDTQMSISSYYFNSGNTSTFILIDTKTKTLYAFYKNLFETQLKKPSIMIIWGYLLYGQDRLDN